MSTPGKHAFDLPEDRPASMDEKGNRVYLHPAEVKGPWRNRRTVFYAVLLVIFLVMPWIQIAGHQAVLLDLPRRRFAFFGLTFWAHDAPMLLFVIGGFAVALLFVTSVWGRVWCGWACPQTVFIDMVFRRIESWVEGNAAERRKLDAAPMSLAKAGKTALKWALFTVASLIIAHSFLAYFVGTDRLAEMMRSSPAAHPGAFAVMLFATGLTLFDFGWFREQFCIVACPYGRLQSVLMDDQSLAPLYDEKRGEPRKFTPGIAADRLGDCVSCYRCVQVCPTGVDIRRGVQMECIACTACIDACDDIMTKVKKPKGLIRYESVLGMGGQKSAWGFRSYLYLSILVAAVIGLTVTVMNRTPFQMTVNRPPDAPYTMTSEGVVNHLRVHMSNQAFNDANVTFGLAGLDRGYKIIAAKKPWPVKAGDTVNADIFVVAERSFLQGGKRQVTLEAVGTDGAVLESFAVELLGPETEK